MNAFNLCEAYAAVYDEDLRDEILEIEEDLSFIDDLSDNELDIIVENVIYEYINEGYSLNKVEHLFECALEDYEILQELNISDLSKLRKHQKDVEKRAANIRKVRLKKSVDSAVQSVTNPIKKGVERAKTYAGGVSSAVQGGAAELGRKATAAKERIKKFIGRQVTKARNIVDVPAGQYAADHRLIKSRSGKTTLGYTRPGEEVKQSGIEGMQRTSSGRRAVRGAVARHKIERAKDAVRRRIEAVKGGVKSAIRGGAISVSRGARNVARRMSEEYGFIAEIILEDLINEGYANTFEEALYVFESLSDYQVGEIVEGYLTEQFETVDLYDVILEHILDEGYADTEEAATAIMANMSEEWREEILEAKRKISPKKAAEIAVKSMWKPGDHVPIPEKKKTLSAGMSEEASAENEEPEYKNMIPSKDRIPRTKGFTNRTYQYPTRKLRPGQRPTYMR